LQARNLDSYIVELALHIGDQLVGDGG